MTIFLSFDCGLVSLACGCYEYYPENEGTTNSLFKILYVNVFDLTEGKGKKQKYQIVYDLYNKAINEINNNTPKIDHVIIEKQFQINTGVTEVMTLLKKTYCDLGIKTTVISSSLKCDIYFTEQLRYYVYRNIYSSQHRAAKKFARDNFVFYVNLFELEVPNIENTDKKRIYDISDTFMQLFAYVKFLPEDNPEQPIKPKKKRKKVNNKRIFIKFNLNTP